VVQTAKEFVAMKRTFKPNKNQASATTRNRINGQVILFLMKSSRLFYEQNTLLKVNDSV
jgi:hypothetical protein